MRTPVALEVARAFVEVAYPWAQRIVLSTYETAPTKFYYLEPNILGCSGRGADAPVLPYGVVLTLSCVVIAAVKVEPVHRTGVVVGWRFLCSRIAES